MRPCVGSLLAAAIGLFGCTSSTSSSDDGPPLPDLTLPPAAPLVTATTATHEAPESGLCTSWTSTVVDVSAFLYASQVWLHGFDGGVSLAAVVPGSGGQITAMAIDPQGRTLGGGAITLPAEPTAELSDVIATSDGGWLVAWLGDADYGPAGNGYAYTVRYDAAGLPVARSPSVLASGVSLVADTSEGERAVLAVELDEVSYRLPTFRLAVYPEAGGTVAVTPTFGGGDEVFGAYRAGTVLTLRTSNEPGLAVRTWNDAGALLSQTTMPFDGSLIPDSEYMTTSSGGGWAGYSSPQYAPGAGGTAVVYAQPNAVAFISPARVLMLPTDIVMLGATPWAEPSSGGHDHVVVGFGGNVPSASGGDDELRIVDVSTTGARGAVGTAPLAPATFARYFSGGVQLAATAAEDAYAVFVANLRSSADLAIFRCASRAP